MFKIFTQINSSGDGFIDVDELIVGLKKIGVILDHEAAVILFSHFDTNNTGSIHYKQILWNFFNKFGFFRQWNRNSKGCTIDQIKKDFFTKWDHSGKGFLIYKDFKMALLKFGINLEDNQVENDIIIIIIIIIIF
jgi:Ca2+-binding EF-hand superfamily protein